MAYGVCKLTGKSGKFVKSHLLPKALTRPGVAGECFISGGPGRRPKKRFSSWYDEKLVIQEGENVLADYDNWAIAELRRLELIWSGWGTKRSLPLETPDWFGPRPEGFGLRQVECANPEKLRLFFLSLLWRAAAATLPEFGDIGLEQDELELLRIMVCDGNPRPLDFYPISLLQIVQKGLPHNLGPIVTDFSFRFYFDGLIVHMFRNSDLEFEQFERLMVGSSSTLVVQTQTLEHSYQLANVKQHIGEGTLNWPEVINRLRRIPHGSTPNLPQKDRVIK
jgi:hypothetical protein